MFGARTPPQLTPTPFSLRLEESRRKRSQDRGGELFDLTSSNPTTAALLQPNHVILEGLSRPGVLQYAADPRGSERARAAISDYYAQRRQAVPDIGLDRIFLTASTSEAYGFLAKLLTNPGDEVLVPVPSYPLFEHLLGLESVKSVPYPLRYDGSWYLDEAALEAAVSPKTRAIILVNPNNPTGSYLKAEELRWLHAFCTEHSLALISDEVFADYAFDALDVAPASDERSLNGEPTGISRTTQESSPVRATPHRVETLAYPVMADKTPPQTPPVLSFSMAGLSKTLGLPQLKLGWILVNGPASQVAEALERLEFITDTYLSVGSPVQEALPGLLAQTGRFQAPLFERLRLNRRILDEVLPLCPELTPLRAEGGWYQLLQVPQVLTEEDWVVTLLERDGVLVQPGFFFDFEREAFLGVSLLTPPDIFREGLSRLVHRVHEEATR